MLPIYSSPSSLFLIVCLLFIESSSVFTFDRIHNIFTMFGIYVGAVRSTYQAHRSVEATQQAGWLLLLLQAPLRCIHQLPNVACLQSLPLRADSPCSLPSCPLSCMTLFLFSYFQYLMFSFSIHYFPFTFNRSLFN